MRKERAHILHLHQMRAQKRERLPLAGGSYILRNLEAISIILEMIACNSELRTSSARSSGLYDDRASINLCPYPYIKIWLIDNQLWRVERIAGDLELHIIYFLQATD